MADGAVREDAVLTLSVNAAGDSGLLAIALDAAFAANGYFYLYYATGEDALDWQRDRQPALPFHLRRRHRPRRSRVRTGSHRRHSLEHATQRRRSDGGRRRAALPGRGRHFEFTPRWPIWVRSTARYCASATATGYAVRPIIVVDVWTARPEVFALGLRSLPRRRTPPTAQSTWPTWAAAWEVNAGAQRGLPAGPCVRAVSQQVRAALSATPAQYTDPVIYYPHPAADDGVPTGSSLTGLAVYGGDALPAAYHGGFFAADLNLRDDYGGGARSQRVQPGAVYGQHSTAWWPCTFVDDRHTS
ncbi:MAG: hypothetical protein R2854_30270 [Caldilineaceae bacterium]